MAKSNAVDQAYQLAKASYAKLGVDTDKALDLLKGIPVSLHCWQGDDVGGFEHAGAARRRACGHGQLSRQGPHGRRAAGRRGQGLSSLIPGQAPVQPARDLRRVRRQEGRSQRSRAGAFSRLDRLGQGTRAGAGLQPDLFFASQGGRRLHAVASRRGHPQVLGRARHRLPQDRRGDGQGAGQPGVTNVWIPDGYKDIPVDRKTPREHLKQSLDEIFARRSIEKHNLDAVEGKLFGIGSESYVVGSHEFYLGYAVPTRACCCASMPGTIIRPKTSPTRSPRC